MRTIVAACLLAAALLSTWSAFTLRSLQNGRVDGEAAIVALAASALATVAAAFALSISIRRRRDWSAGYVVGSLGIALFSLFVGTWAWFSAF